MAGQTAPGGITVTGARLRVVDSNVIIRGMTVRPGDETDGQDPDSRDGVSIGKSGETVENVILDSNSLSWSIDEVASTWGAPSNITISNNIVAEALQDSIHPKGDHSMGMLIGDGSSNVSIIGNLFASNQFRNALVKDDAKNIEFINNVIYNWGQEGLVVAEASTVHVIGNVFIRGQDTDGREAIRFIGNDGGAAFYVLDNDGDIGGSNTGEIVTDFVFDPATTEVLSSGAVVDWVLSNVGARINGELSEIDQRIIDTVLNDTGKIIDSPDEVGGYGDGSQTKALTDTDDDGIPDFYEYIIGSDAKTADAQLDADGDGYANIEDYINGLLDGFDETTDGGNTGTETGDKTEEDGDDTATLLPETGDNTGAAVGTVITLEAEDLVLSEGFAVKSIGPASGGTVIQNSTGEAQTASYAFDGDAGVYALTLNYFDENDGVSTLRVLINGEEVTSWDWDAELGSSNADTSTQTSKLIDGLELQAGDVLSLQGVNDSGEPLRIDSLSLEMTGTLDSDSTDSDLDAGTEIGTGTETGTETGNSDAIGTVISYEAEDLDLSDGFAVKKIGPASGNAVIQNQTDEAQTASLDFDGDAGVYDLTVNYFDENDGVSSLSVLVNGEEVASWDWDAKLGSSNADTSTQTAKLIEGLELQAGDTVTLQGINDAREPLRIDSLSLEMTGTLGSTGSTGSTDTTEEVDQPVANTAEWVFMEAEEFVFDADVRKGFKVASLMAASGGEVLSAAGDAEASADFEGTSGTYDVGIDYFDETDGVSYLEFRVNGEVMDAWHWDADLGDNLANKSTLTRHVIENVDIDAGDQLVLAGYGDGGSEPLRIDALEFMPSDTVLG
ncbi:right-handed parallel beta-helix repeat-containing protein [Alloyangia pacifica]|uniref:right-handed parallel beta-helix repeat-containing protein n=1 Tax=Alloyangia pacifica TaxID=311180 RepID=UPI001CD71569|nr:right-handed parallel beta-helix repeat-containing protein [Alloyangia pacifica]MCA0997949.1 right-handed parallel beta-helix repeat-containing protein [Alloyangia pacifica]